MDHVLASQTVTVRGESITTYRREKVIEPTAKTLKPT